MHFTSWLPARLFKRLGLSASMTLALTLVLGSSAASATPQLPSKPSGPIVNPQATANPPSACCQITSINAATGVVSAKVDSTGQSFQFTLKEAALLRSLKVGQGVLVNFKTKQVSLDGKRISGTIVALGSATPSQGPVERPSAPSQSATAPKMPSSSQPSATPQSATASPTVVTSRACCSITNINSATGVVSAKVNATGQTFQFKASPQQLAALKVGQGIFANLKSQQVSLNGTQPCCQIVSLGPIVHFGQPYNFQKCCTMLPQGVRVLNNAPPSATASVPGNAFPIIFYDLPSYDAQFPQGLPGGAACVNTEAGQPIYADFTANLVSRDGVTPCGYMSNAVETVYLDVVPVGVVYVPPGDPKAGLTGPYAPSQQFSSTDQTQTTTTTTTMVISGQSTKVSISGPIAITASGSQTVQQTNANQQQNMHSFLSQAPPATGGAGYPGVNDIVVFFLNPTYDVQYFTGYNLPDPAHPYPPKIDSITPHTPQTYEPGPQWELISASTGEIGTQTGAAQFLLTDLLKAPPQGPLPINSPTGSSGDICAPVSKGGNSNQIANYRTTLNRPTPLQGVVQRLLALDPMLGSTDPACVPSHSERFTPITMFQDANGAQYTPGAAGIAWTFCQYPGPYQFTNTVAQTSTTITSTTTKFTSGVTMGLNPVQLFTMATGVSTGGAGASVEFGNTWEVDTTTQFQSQNGFQLTSKGQFGSGMTPYNGSCPPNLPGFRTALYYDWQNLTVLFWTQVAN